MSREQQLVQIPSHNEMKLKSMVNNWLMFSIASQQLSSSFHLNRAGISGRLYKPVMRMSQCLAFLKPGLPFAAPQREGSQGQDRDRRLKEVRGFTEFYKGEC